MSNSAISMPPVRSSQKRPGDVIPQSSTKRTQLTLPQIPPDMEQAPLMDDKVATPLSDEQFADLFDVIMRCEWEIHSDWKTIANSKERLTIFLRAVRVAGSALKDALDETWVDGAFTRIQNTAFLRSLLPKDPSLNISDEGVAAVRNEEEEEEEEE
ncbi:hypothetical protein QCA50_016713 [Cerrena zonata]|uniref:Uncharacterized protein n=1 Tax=Cerrena zonata TaxID=2478898 RepID=A0AAW0FKX2_9APHY